MLIYHMTNHMTNYMTNHMINHMINYMINNVINHMIFSVGDRSLNPLYAELSLYKKVMTDVVKPK